MLVLGLMTAPRLARIITCFHVFINCPRCGHHNEIAGIPPKRVDLAMLRGSEDKIKCKKCHADVDTMRAYRGEQIGEEIVRREDPQS